MRCVFFVITNDVTPLPWGDIRICYLIFYNERMNELKNDISYVT